MSTTQLTIVCLTLIILAVAVLRTRHLAHEDVAAEARRRYDLEAMQRVRESVKPPLTVGDRVTVHTTDDRSLHGVVLDESHGRLRLGDAQLVTASGKQPIPGGVVSLPAVSEAFRQEHEAPTPRTAVRELAGVNGRL
jgi:hypothetical protein